jgi:hypothetical protein
VGPLWRLPWAHDCSDGVKVGGVFGSKEAAFEAATVAATFAVRDGAAIQINVPSAPEADEIPLNWISAIEGVALRTHPPK